MQTVDVTVRWSFGSSYINWYEYTSIIFVHEIFYFYESKELWVRFSEAGGIDILDPLPFNWMII